MTKLPWRFVAPITLTRFALGCSWAVLHPYVTEQVASFGVSPESLGFWVGVIEASLQLAEGLITPVIVYLSEFTGRKPVILACMMLYSWCLLPIGISKSLGALFFWRMAQGMFTAFSPITKGIIAEVCDDSNRSQGFGMMGFTFGIGYTLGPLIGGHLANLARFESMAKHEWIVQYPYLAPSLAVLVMTFVIGILVQTYMPETLSKEKRLRWGASGDNGRDGETKLIHMALRLLRYKPFRDMLILDFLTAGLSFTCDVVFVLVLAAKPPYGAGMDPAEIGDILLASAVVLSVFTLVLFSKLERKLTTAVFMNSISVAWIVTIAAMSGMAWLANVKEGEGNYSKLGMWMLIIVSIPIKRYADLAINLIETSVQDRIEIPSQLAFSHSLIFSIAGFGRGICPIFFGALFAFSSKGGSIQRSTVWVGLFALSTFTWWFSSTRWLAQTNPEKAEDYELLRTGIDDDSGEEEEDSKMYRPGLPRV